MPKPIHVPNSIERPNAKLLPRELDLKVEYQPISSLKPNKRNPRTHSEKQIARIGQSYATFGVLSPLLVDDENNLIAGHGRLEAAKRVGIETLPTIRIGHLTEAQKRAYVIADNQLAALAGWDEELLALELQFLAEIDVEFDVTITGFETAEIDLRIESLDTDPGDGDDIPLVDSQSPSITRRGDIWLLGPHRLLCGDATDYQDYEKLLGARRAHVGINDVPFNLRVKGHVSGLGKVQHREFVMASGEMSAEQYQAFLTTVLTHQCAYTMPGAINFVFIDWRHICPLIAAGAPAYADPVNVCVWVKSNGGMGSTYRSQHELVVVFKRPGAPHKNNVQLGSTGWYRTNVWHYPGANSFKRNRDKELSLHPTVKPVPLVADAIKDVSNRGDIVLDCFMGSGTTIIAAHKTGRHAYGMELDPLYVDTAVRRWQEFTGERAIHADTGLSFDQLMGTRHG